MKITTAWILLLLTIAPPVVAEGTVEEELAERILGQGNVIASDLSGEYLTVYVQYKGSFYFCYTRYGNNMFGGACWPFGAWPFGTE